MSDTHDAQGELRRRFEAMISGSELTDLRELGSQLAAFGYQADEPVERRELRRPPLPTAAIFRIRIDLDNAEPPIWRRLDVRSDVTLDIVHQVLQAVFGWADSHLHRFALGGGPFDRTSQLFLCPHDVQEPEYEDEGGTAAADVRLDEAVQDPGDVLHYVYDYGDSWEVTLRLEEIRPAGSDTPMAVAVDGRRAAPPDDSGGAVDADSLAEILDDPAHFDLAEINAALRDPYFVLNELGIHRRLTHLIHRLQYSPVGADIAARALLLSELPAVDDEDLSASLRAYTWFLDRADGDGMPLTSAGYLKPADVEAASRVVPGMAEWIGKNNRESLAIPLLDFRHSLQSMGLLRKYKGTLRLTRLGGGVKRDPRQLWELLADRLVPSGDEFSTDATLLLLLYAGTATDGNLLLDPVAVVLSHLGWRHRDGRPLRQYELYGLPAIDTLRNVSDQPAEILKDRISPMASALARAALMRPGVKGI